MTGVYYQSCPIFRRIVELDRKAPGQQTAGGHIRDAYPLRKTKACAKTGAGDVAAAENACQRDGFSLPGSDVAEERFVFLLASLSRLGLESASGLALMLALASVYL